MGENKGHLGVIAFFILSLAPLAIWISIQPLDGRFANINYVFTSIGQVLGLLGMAMFSLSIIIETKIKFISDFFGGLGGLHKSHHNLGTLAFVLILFHPLFLALKFALFSIKGAALFLLPGANFSINFGIIAIVLMEIILLITFFARIKYQLWKINHDFIGIAFFFAALHVFFISSDVSRSMLLRYYMLSLIGIALIAFACRIYLNLKEYFIKGKNNTVQ